MKLTIALLAIATLIFAILYFNQKSKLNEVPVSDTHRLLDVSTIKDAIRNSVSTSPIDYDIATRRYVPYFHKTFDPSYDGTNIGKIPFGVWVDLSIILPDYKTTAVDGFYIVPIQYDADIKVGNSTFKKDSVNFMVVFTNATPIAQRATLGTHTPITTLAFDFNQPCPHLPCP